MQAEEVRVGKRREVSEVSMLTRRSFVALGGLAIPSSLLAQEVFKGVGGQPNVVRTPTLDPVLKSISDELVDVHRRRVRDGYAKPEHARRAASANGILVSYGAVIHLNARVQSSVATRIQQEGRDTVISTMQPYRDSMVAEAKAKGIDMSDLPAFPPYDTATRSQLLDQLLATGITPTFARAQAAFTQAGDKLDKTARLDGGAYVHQAQSCSGIYDALLGQLSLAAQVVCSQPELFELCALILVDIGILLSLKFMLC